MAGFHQGIVVIHEGEDNAIMRIGRGKKFIKLSGGIHLDYCPGKKTELYHREQGMFWVFLIEFLTCSPYNIEYTRRKIGFPFCTHKNSML